MLHIVSERHSEILMENRICPSTQYPSWDKMAASIFALFSEQCEIPVQTDSTIRPLFDHSSSA